jgi:hypothetical protein
MSEEAVTASTPTNDAGAANENTESNTPVTPEAAHTPEAKVETPEVPESYDLQMPEGVELDKAAADEFTVIAKELKLDQASAQKLADVAAKQAQRQAEAHKKMVESWVESVKTDKDIGGDNLEQNLGIARKALEDFGTPELRDVLNATGFGNHPEIIKAFYKAGKAIGEDGFVKGSAKGPDTDPAKRMFPNMN